MYFLCEHSNQTDEGSLVQETRHDLGVLVQYLDVRIFNILSGLDGSNQTIKVATL